MKHHRHHGQQLHKSASSGNPKQKLRVQPDKFFHLRTTIALNDPFLQHVYGVVSNFLDDHPYPQTRDEYRRRTREINRNIQELNLSTTQLQFLQRLIMETGITVVDLWQGSHVIALDNGILYNTWSKLPTALPRFSSHYRQVPIQQFGISFRDHQLLFGKTAVDGSTWFQMEAHAFDPNDFYNDPDLVVSHGQDFLKYRVHRMNVGPFGFSPHTEMMDPVVLPYKPLRANIVHRHKSSRYLK